MNSIIYRILLLPIFIASFVTGSAQDTLMTLRLEEVIAIAQGDAPQARIAETRLNNNYWRYQSFLADYRPRIDFFGNFADLNRSLEGITLPDGTVDFIERSFIRNLGQVSLRQEVAETGATIFTNTRLERLDILATDNVDGSTSYLFSPISIRFEQPIFAFNPLKWNRKAEPLRYKESQRIYSEDMERVAFESVGLFFDLFIAQLNLEAAEKEKSNADTLYNLSKGRFEVGRIAETELLQIELSAMRANTNLAQATLNVQTSNEALRNYLGITNAVRFSLLPPENIPVFNIDPVAALDIARANRSKSIEFQRRAIEAQLRVAESRGQIGPNLNIAGEFGLQQRVDGISEFFDGLLDQERFNIALNLPIADWGKAKSRLQIAESQRDLELMNIEQEQVNFERNIILKVQQFNLVRDQVALAQRTYEIAQKRQRITRQRYLIGKIGITELNIAITEEDNARRTYIGALRNFWVAYYELRNLTLFDFENNKSLLR